MKKLRFQPTFASLTEAELERLAHEVQRETYDAVRERVCKPRSEGGLDLRFTSNSPLVRLHNKKNRLDLINAQITSGKKLTLAQLGTFTAGDSGPCGEHRAPEEVHDAIMSATYILVTEHDNTPHQLLALQRLADFPARAEYRKQTAAVRAERLEISRSKENRAKEMHAHKIQLDLRKQTLKEKTVAFNQDLALHRLNLNPNLFSEDPQNTEAMNSSDASLSFQNHGRGAFHPRPTSISRDAITDHDAAPEASYPSSNQNQNPNSENSSSPSVPSVPLVVKNSFLSPEVIANTNLYDQKIDTGEIRVIYAPGKHYEIEYCNPADAPALERFHKSAPLRFFQDPTRTHYLPGLRTFGKNPVIPTAAQEEPPATTPNPDNPVHPVQNLPSPSSPVNTDPLSSPETLNSKLKTKNSASLEEAVAAYTILRAREYLAYEKRRSEHPHSDPNPFPQYVTQYRYCPCGQGSETQPCPIHEDENTFGRYFSYFWTLSPFGIPYANRLHERGLPYRQPIELLP